MYPTCTELYLDANATTPTLPSALEAACAAMREQFGNPSSSHCTGLRAKALLETVRSDARQVLGAGKARLFFTSGATEGIQTAVLSTLSAHLNASPEIRAKRQLLLYGASEHKVVPEALKHWNQVLHANCELLAIPVDSDGRHDLAFLAAHVDRAVLVCTMAVNNETGVISDLDAIETILQQHPECLWLVDGVQALGKLALNLSRTRIDYFAVSGHKLYAPKGIGMLYARQSAPFTALTAGGGQEQGQRSGTENMAGIAGFGAVLAELNRPKGELCSIDDLQRYRDALITALCAAFPGIVFNSPIQYCVPTTLNFSVPGFASKELLDLFDAAGMRVSSGSACGSGKAMRSYVLDAMGVAPWRSLSAVRLSFGRAWHDEDCGLACQRIAQAGNALRDSCLYAEPSTRQDHFDGVLLFKHDGACCWLIVDHIAKQCAIIDPVDELCERLERYVSCQGFSVVAVLDTHAHADHVSARERLLRTLASNWLQPQEATDGLGWPLSTAQRALNDGNSYPVISIGHFNLVQIPLPGHTDDSVGYVLFKDSDEILQVFVGDTVLIGGIGRSNFASSSVTELFHSLRRLAAVAGTNTLLCPAHDYFHQFATTLQVECRDNPLMAQALAPTPSAETLFVAAKTQLDTSICDEKGATLMCGALRHEVDPNISGMEFHSAQLRSFLHQHPHAILVDVREPYECALGATLEQLPSCVTRTVPLSRLDQMLPEWLHHPEQPLVFFCRSGNRSLLAARALHRLGHPLVYHLRGGLALHH